MTSPCSYVTLTYLAGHSRGGTTWLGELLACHGKARYLFEPFASQAHPCTGIDTQTIFNGGRFIRLQKRGSSLPDIPLPRFFREAPVAHQPDPFGELARQHLDRLVAHYFAGEHGYHLLLKQPRLENLAWVVAVLGAPRVVVLDRHPFGVVNSLWRWNVVGWSEIEWQILRRDTKLPSTYQTLIEDARRPAERLLVLSYLRSMHARHFCRTCSEATFVQYEQLCRDPWAQIPAIWRQLGWPVQTADLARLEVKLAARQPVSGDRFLDTNQDPQARCDAWRHELPATIREQLMSFSSRHDLVIPVPGRGLPPLTRFERWQSQRREWSRRWRNLKQRCGLSRRAIEPQGDKLAA